MAQGGRSLVDSLNRLIQHPPKARERLGPPDAAEALRGRGQAKPTTETTGTGAGIASPLTEPDAAERTYHPEQALTSSDGVFTIMIEPLQRLVLQDANSAEVVVEYAIPPAP